jgi:hypothetical protein
MPLGRSRKARWDTSPAEGALVTLVLSKSETRYKVFWIILRQFFREITLKIHHSI